MNMLVQFIAGAIVGCMAIVLLRGDGELNDPESDWGHDADDAGGEDE